MSYMYVEPKFLNLNKNEIHIESKANLLVVMFTSAHCSACKRERPIFEKTVEQLPKIKFGVFYVDKNMAVLEKLKSVGLVISHTPCYALFKLSVFDRILDIQKPTKIEFQNSMFNEITCIDNENNKYKNNTEHRNSSQKYLTLEEI